MLDAERRRIGVRVYDDETRALAVEAVGAGFTMREAAELAGCSRRAVSDWCRAAGVEPARKKPVYLPYEEKMELVARYEAGVTGPAVTGWARRLREEGALSLMTEGDVRARVPEPAARAESLRAEFGLPRVLAALSLAGSTYYHRRSRAAAHPDAALRPLVLEEFEASGGRYGYRRVHAALRARGVRASEKRVRSTSAPPWISTTATSWRSPAARRPPRRSSRRCWRAPWPPSAAASRCTPTAAGTTGPRTGWRRARRPGSRGPCRGRATLRTTPPARASSGG